jgi:hypothetical protein
MTTLYIRRDEGCCVNDNSTPNAFFFSNTVDGNYVRPDVTVIAKTGCDLF